jgi:glycolate oxidase FAD binding subunit
MVGMLETDTLIQDLREIAGEAAVSVDMAQLEATGLDGQLPRAVVRPGTPEEAAAFLKYANSHDLKVAIRGGGVHSGIGNPPERLDLVLSTSGMAAITEYSPADLMVGVQAGVKLSDLRAELAKNGQFLPVEAAGLAQGATIGGAIASNTSGPFRLAHGPARDWLIGVKFILADGTRAKGGGKVVKNVAGYDMMKLFIGTLGTLGLIYEMNFKLLPDPPVTSTLIISLADCQAAVRLALAAIEAGTFPAALTALDRGAAQALGLPESPATLLVEVRNTAQALERQVRDITRLGRESGALSIEVLSELPEQQALWQKVTDFGYRETSGQRLALKISALPDQSAALLDQAHALAEKLGLEVSLLSHAGHGLSWLTGTYSNEDKALELVRELTGWAERKGGSVAAEHLPLALKQRVGDVWGTALSEGEVRLMRSIKAKLDPNRTLSPGRFVARI